VVVVVSGSNWLVRRASDDEQGSKEGDHRRGKFHRIALPKFCWNLEQVKLINRLEVRSEKQIHRQLLVDLERVLPLYLPINQELCGLSWCTPHTYPRAWLPVPWPFSTADRIYPIGHN
jgi:hypothetical protein